MPDDRDRPCLCCGRPVASSGIGRRRLYCRRACRQRAYEQRSAVDNAALPEGSVVLSADEASAVVDRAYLVRCAAEDVRSALVEGAPIGDTTDLCESLLELARDAERLR